MAQPVAAFSFAVFPFQDIFTSWRDDFIKNNPPPQGVQIEILKPEELSQHSVVSPIGGEVHGFSVSDMFGLKSKIHEIAATMHQQSLLTPDPNDDNIDFIKYLYDFAGSAPITHFLPDPVKELIIFSMALTNEFCHTVLEFVFKKIYELVTTLVIFTPEWIFGNDWFPSSVLKYSILNIGIIIIFTMIEGIKRMLKKSHTSLTEVAKKLPIALGVSAGAPWIFLWGVKALNKLTKLILNLNVADTINTPNVSAISLAFEPFNLIMMTVFIGVIIYLCIPLFIFHGKRWYHFLMNALLTPFAMSAYLFQSTERYFHMWLRNILNLSAVQLVYAFFISILGLLMFATPAPTTMTDAFVKMLVMCGGITTLAFPPQIIREFEPRGNGSVIDLFKKGHSSLLKGEKIIRGINKKNAENFLINQASGAGKRFRFYKNIFNPFKRK